MRRTRTGLAVTLAAALLLIGCGEPDGVDAPAGTDGAGAPEAPDEDEGFDPERSRELAESYLGLAEDEFEETVMVRILRRGDERLAGTMDLRPGRLNLELDDDGEGTYRVTRIVVETEEGEDLVVE